MYYNIVVQKALSRNQIEKHKNHKEGCPYGGLSQMDKRRRNPIRGKTAPAKNPLMGIWAKMCRLCFAQAHHV